MTKLSVSVVFGITAITTAVLLFAAGSVMAATPPTIVVNPCPVNTVWLGGNTCQLVNTYGSGFDHGFDHGFGHH
jgi:hypothetical protein